MRRSRLGCVALVLVMVAGACKKQPAGEAGAPANDSGSKARVPALFAHVPSDTPYLVAALEAVPVDYYARLMKAFKPLLERAERELRKQDSKALHAVLDELSGKWNQAGLESLGLSTQPRLAFYGLGLQPFVARIEIRDHKVLQATIERIATKAGASLPPMKTREGRSYWIGGSDDKATFVLALADNQLIAAVGAAADVNAKLGLILGDEKPGQNMADGKLIKELMARHGIGPHMVGFADTRRIADAGFEVAMGKPSPACTAEIARVSAKAPRLVFGYSELSARKLSGGLIVELSPEVNAAARTLKTEIPGLAAALAAPSLMTIGGGVDLARGQQLVMAIADNMKQVGAACGLEGLVSGSEKASAALSRPLPEPLGALAGGVVLVNDVVINPQNPDAMPEKLEAVAVLASPDAKGLFAKLTAQRPEIAELGIEPDGKLHDVAAGKLPLPFQAAAAVTDTAMVLAVGDTRASLGDQMLRAGGSANAPLFAMSYDYGRFLALVAPLADKGSDSDPLVADLYAMLSSTFGRFAATIDVTPGGLAMWSTLEMK